MNIFFHTFSSFSATAVILLNSAAPQWQQRKYEDCSPKLDVSHLGEGTDTFSQKLTAAPLDDVPTSLIQHLRSKRKE